MDKILKKNAYFLRKNWYKRVFRVADPENITVDVEKIMKIKKFRGYNTSSQYNLMMIQQKHWVNTFFVVPQRF